MKYFVGVTVYQQSAGQWFAYLPERVIGPFKSEGRAWREAAKELENA